MRLLIVDDEELTRTGVISSIDWKALGIQEIYQADDGIHGLETAKLHRPEIILCDVRMPRMDGITMLEELESVLPNTVPIFMSGYSDKEYLKAAIKLKAVNYIEKPLNPAEIQEAILEAKEVYTQKLRSNQGETFHSIETASRIALQLTVPYGTNKDVLSRLCAELSLPIQDETSFTAFIVKLDSSADQTELYLGEIYDALMEFLQPYGFDCIYAEKRGQYIVYFLFGDTAPSKELITSAAHLLNQQYQQLGRHFIACGETVTGIANAYHSYAFAVILLQSSFFFPADTLLTPDILHSANPHPQMPSAWELDFSKALFAKDQKACDELLLKIHSVFNRSTSLMQNQAKDLYYKMFLVLNDARSQILLSTSSGKEETITETLERCFTYEDLHQILLGKTDLFFSELQNAVQENPTILLIKDYISNNYRNETLSVKDISSHVFLSASYVCTFFKNETGQTLNQYLTEYRMEKAKQLLSDPRYKITDISSQVGYSDGNYFGKSFKKYSGLSPSEYREKTLR